MINHRHIASEFVRGVSTDALVRRVVQHYGWALERARAYVEQAIRTALKRTPG